MMKLLYEFFPIIVFFVIFKLYGIYAATTSAIIISGLQVLFYWLKYRRFDKMLLLTFVGITVFGGATLIFHNPLFIKWKVSIIYWILSIAFLASQWFGKKNLIQRMLDQKITLPNQIWLRLNLLWALYFLTIGFINIYVAYHFSTETWVNFKLFGMLGLLIIFMIIQGAYLMRHIKHD